ncbi:MAG: nucleoside triphosphate pyrophosphatase [Chthoniobacterales bacterium]
MRSRLLLASRSPRRRQLLKDAGLDFGVVVPAVVESDTRRLSIRELTTLNAMRKALAVAREHGEAVVLGADTLVALDGNLIGKPADLAEAVAILRRLSGRQHDVCTSVFIARFAGCESISFYVMSRVQFRSLGADEIRAYLRKVNPLDKAGAYAAQGHRREIIERIRGSYTNVVGLPMDETLRALRRFGIEPRRPAVDAPA